MFGAEKDGTNKIQLDMAPTHMHVYTHTYSKKQRKQLMRKDAGGTVLLWYAGFRLAL